MTEETILALNQINRQFYQSQAQSWERSRRYFWPSWQKFWKNSKLKNDSIGNILDIGCGTGRFFNFWQQQMPTGKWDYLGLDNSESLLALASQNANSQDSNTAHWQQLDVVETLLSKQPVSNSSFKLITLFGVIHHIPSFALRSQLINQLYDLLLPGGELWLTTWQPQRTGQRVPSLVDPQEVMEYFEFDYQQLESGDVFIGWHDTPVVRYVHWWQPEEDEILIAHDGMQVVKHWSETAKGERGNLCWLLQKTD